MKLAVAVLVSLLLAGCASIQPDPGALTPTQLRQSSSLYDGKQVTVVAWMTLGHEDANLWTDAQDMNSRRTIHCVSLENFDDLLEAKGALNGHRVELTGTFRKDVVGESGTIRFSACSRSALEPTSVREL